MSVTVRFTDFWKNSKPTQDNFFVPLVENVYQSKVTLIKDPSIKVDLEIFSVFKEHLTTKRRVVNRLQRISSRESPQSPLRLSRNARKSIWFTGENKRPPLSLGHDCYLGFEPDGFIDNVHYLPLWVLNLDNFGRGPSHGFTSANYPQEHLFKPRKLKSSKSDQRKFCCAFISNPMSYRMGILQELSTIDSVDVFGRAVNKPIDDKFTVAQDYRFGIAFENNIYPGYVTEKMLEAYCSGTVPVYWGHDSEEYFNPGSFINLYDYQSLQEFKNDLEEIHNDSARYEQVFSQPLLARPYDIEKLINLVRTDLL